MSIEAENVEHEDELESGNEQIIRLLKAILIGIEIIASSENLIENIED